MDVKPTERSVKQPSFTRGGVADVDKGMDQGFVITEAHLSRGIANVHDRGRSSLQILAEMIGKCVAHLRAVIVQNYERLYDQHAARVISHTETLAAGNVVAEPSFEMIEVMPSRHHGFTQSELTHIFCLDLEKFGIEAAIDWIRKAQESNRLLPQLVVVTPPGRLSNLELQAIAEEIARVAVVIPRFSEGSSFEETLEKFRAEIVKVLDPRRLTVKTSLETAGESREVAVPSI